MNTKQFTVLSLIGVLVTSALFACSLAFAMDIKFYRYVGENGVETIQTSIPPKFAQNGYDIITSRGELIRRVPPALSTDEVKKIEGEKQLFGEFLALKKRYNSVDDIESARERRLASIRVNIGVLEGNAGSLRDQIDRVTLRAAQFEREGKAVPNHITEKVDGSKKELEVIADLLEVRHEELDRVNAEFDRDVDTFLAGQKLVDEMSGRNKANGS